MIPVGVQRLLRIGDAPAAGRPPRASGSPPAGPPESIPWRRCGRIKIRAAMPQFGGCRRRVMAPNLRIAL